MNIQNALKKHYQIQNVFIENRMQIDSFVKHCRIVFEMKFHEFHETKKLLFKYKCSIFSNCTLNFLNSQMNGAVFMFQKIFEYVFLIFKFFDDLNITEMADKLKNVKTKKNSLLTR